MTAKAHKGVEQVAERVVAVPGNLGTEACPLRYSIEAHKVVPGSCATAGKPDTAVADGPYYRTVLAQLNMEFDGYRLVAQSALGGRNGLAAVTFVRWVKAKASSTRCPWFCLCMGPDERDGARLRQSRTIAGAAVLVGGLQSAGVG